MAVLAAAQLLDELMGRNRNAPCEKRKEPNWEDPEYCVYFMVKFCPHDLFVNTRADLGTCSKVHDEEVRKLFQESKSHRKLQYQEEFVRFCSNMVNDVERKIQKGKNRLALSGKNELNAHLPSQNQKNQEKIDLLNERINELEAEAEQAGTDGNVEQAQGLMKLCDKLKDERDALKKQSETGHWSAEVAAAQEKQMEVCEVCGAFLIVGDAQQRIDDHLSGKQHMGFARLKAAVEEISQVVQAAKEEKRRGGSGRGSGDDKLREKERDRDRERRRDRDLERRDRRDKEKEKEREREREKERERRERLERKEREKERDRDRERKDREKKHRSERDFDREPRSRHHSHHRH